jgi:hypothetical protein
LRVKLGAAKTTGTTEDELPAMDEEVLATWLSEEEPAADVAPEPLDVPPQLVKARRAPAVTRR